MLAAVRVTQPPPQNSRSAVGQGTIDELKALGYLGRADVGSATNVPEPSLLPDPKDRIEEQNLLHAAMIASAENRSEDARQSLKQALQLNPKSATALRDLGEMELHAGDYAKAAQHLKEAMEVRPNDASVAFHLGQALEKLHDLTDARDALEASLKLLPGRFQARLLLGQIYLELNQRQAAEDQFEAALLLESKSVDAQIGVARAQIAESNFNGAVQQLEPLTKSRPGIAEAFELLAQAYTGFGRMVEAQRAATRAEELQCGEYTSPISVASKMTSRFFRRVGAHEDVASSWAWIP